MQSHPTGRSKRDERAYSQKRESLASIPEELVLAGLVVGGSWLEAAKRRDASGWR
ncbi:MAG: hypothetical protein P8M53_09565 [Pirellulales bacterium]|nr:hypothetical protein [Pirellulales bacterium]